MVLKICVLFLCTPEIVNFCTAETTHGLFLISNRVAVKSISKNYSLIHFHSFLLFPNSYSMNSYDNGYYNGNVMNFDLIANDYVDSTTYDQRLILSMDAQFNLTNSSNGITNGTC